MAFLKCSTFLKRFFVFTVTVFCLLASIGCSHQKPQKAATTEIRNPNFVYLQLEHLESAKQKIASDDIYLNQHFDAIIQLANIALNKQPDPVVNKTLIPPSGDKHDYLSIAPYFWPNPSSEDGLPWSPKDGQVNPMTRGKNTDQVRLKEMFADLEVLGLAYFYSGQAEYALKMRDIIGIWFIDPKTRVNPNVNFGQSVPGGSKGRPLGVIEWTDTDEVINALQLLEANDFLKESDVVVMRKWFSDYVAWLTTSALGKEEDAQPQNHGNWYDYQVVGILTYLDRKAEAAARVEQAKTKRIADQIQADGSQPMELRRTKSVNYSCMNLDAMVKVAALGKRLGVDLWSYQSPAGASLSKAFDFLRPYAKGEKPWAWEQITFASKEEAIKERMWTLFSTSSTILGEPLVDESTLNQFSERLTPQMAIKYPPLLHIVPTDILY